MLQGTVFTIPTASIVDIITANTETFQDAFQFGLATDTWTLVGQKFRMEVKASRDDATALAAFTSDGDTIVVDDTINRTIHMNVPDTTIQSELQAGEYVYDLVMYDTSSPPVRTILMQGKLFIRQGVTEGP